MRNPIISPCKCTGSMGTIHLNCLRKWIRQKVLITENPPILTIHWKTLSCEVCKEPYPYAIFFNGNIYELINLPQIKTPYVVFESAGKPEDDSSNVTVCSFEKTTKITVGRSQECEWRLQDVSVSRHHANLIWSNGNIYVEDNKSKFGTLKSYDVPLEIQADTKLTLQMGRTICEFTMEKPWNLFTCFDSKPHHTKTLSTEEQKDVDNFQNLFPSNGKHALFVVNKKKYAKMILKEDYKKKDNKIIDERYGLHENKVFMRTMSVHPSNFKGINIMKTQTKATEANALRSPRHSPIDFWQNIKIPRGDTADDVHGEEEI